MGSIGCVTDTGNVPCFFELQGTLVGLLVVLAWMDPRYED